MADQDIDRLNDVSRRNFIKGVIAAGAAVSSAAYVFRGSPLLGQQASASG
jgi:protein involved in ribonucleotide reduction